MGWTIQGIVREATRQKKGYRGMRIAIYGKGGIGKSTIAANLSAALAHAGKRVLQIGCDPKHDSTRLLLNGTPITPVLDYLRAVPPERQSLTDVLQTGASGVVCVEAGGPEPGVGCAGRGILSTFALLGALGLETDSYDVVLYDVLGDVVCGGFAVPLRKGYADALYIVTSEEFMAIYAANNILRGARNFDGIRDGVGGIILNSRGDDEQQEAVQRFAHAVHLPITITIPRSDLFRQAEERGKTVVEAFPGTTIVERFVAFAQAIIHTPPLFPARPLNEQDLEHIVLKGESRRRRALKDVVGANGHPSGEAPAPADLDMGASVVTPAPNPPPITTPATPSRYLSKSMLVREPLHGCAFAGAVSTTTQVQDAITLAHGPRSCSHIASQTILSSGMRTFRQHGIAVPEQLTPMILSSEMSESVAIYGGSETLCTALRTALRRQPRAIFIVTTCPSGIIGDDIGQAISQVSSEGAVPPILVIGSDGNIQGDYMQGVINACIEGAATLVDPHCTPQDDLVNIIAEKNIATNADANMARITELLKTLGLRVHCRFVRRTSFEELRGLLKAPLNLLAYNDHMGRILSDMLITRFGATMATHPFPVGVAETHAWIDEIARFFGRTHQAETAIAQFREVYDQRVRVLRRYLQGKRLLIVSYNHDVDWLLEIALDLEMEVVKVGVMNYCVDYQFRTRYTDRFVVETNYPPEQRDDDIVRLKPHLVLTNYVPQHVPIATHVDSIPMCPDVGFASGLRLAERWATLLKAPVQEGWRHDRALF